MLSEEGTLLIETIQIIESVNLTELLPLNALAWYEQRKLEGEVEMRATPAERFIKEQAQNIE